jgi:hypothetical protein
MATTQFFEEVVQDKERKENGIDLEFGRSSFYRDNLIYLRVDDTTVILDEATGRRLCEAMADLATYLGYDK